MILYSTFSVNVFFFLSRNFIFGFIVYHSLEKLLHLFKGITHGFNSFIGNL